MEGADASSVTRANGRTHHAHDADHRPQKDGLLEETRRKITARLEIQKDDIQAVLPISKVMVLVIHIVMHSIDGRKCTRIYKEHDMVCIICFYTVNKILFGFILDTYLKCMYLKHTLSELNS